MKNTKKALFIAVLAALLFSGCLSTSPVVVEEALPEDLPGGALPPGFFVYSRDIYEYDENGNLVRGVYMYDKGVASRSTNVYEYNERGFAVKKMVYNDKSNLKEYEVYELDEQGRHLKEHEYRADGSLKNYKVYEYNDSENTEIKKFYDPKGLLYRYRIFIRDENGNLVEEVDYRKN